MRVWRCSLVYIAPCQCARNDADAVPNLRSSSFTNLYSSSRPHDFHLRHSINVLCGVFVPFTPKPPNPPCGVWFELFRSCPHSPLQHSLLLSSSFETSSTSMVVMVVLGRCRIFVPSSQSGNFTERQRKRWSEGERWREIRRDRKIGEGERGITRVDLYFVASCAHFSAVFPSSN